MTMGVCDVVHLVQRVILARLIETRCLAWREHKCQPLPEALASGSLAAATFRNGEGGGNVSTPVRFLISLVVPKRKQYLYQKHV